MAVSVSDHLGHEIILVRGQCQVQLLRKDLCSLLQCLDLLGAEL